MQQQEARRTKVLQKHTVAGVSRAWNFRKLFTKGCKVFSEDHVFSWWADGGYSEFGEYEEQCAYIIFRETWFD